MDSKQWPEYLPTTQDIRDAFADEITSLGGVVTDVADDGRLLFARAVLDADAEIRDDDTVRLGVAVRVMPAEIVVHPYTFRRVCSNGAISAHSLESRHIERIEATEVYGPTYEVTATLATLRDAIRACSSPESFATVADELRSAVDAQADIALQLLPLLARLPDQTLATLMPQIFDRFADDRDPSAFGLMNAVTSVARDTCDPETRWNLEALGGSIPARLRAQERKPIVPAAAAAV